MEDVLAAPRKSVELFRLAGRRAKLRVIDPHLLQFVTRVRGMNSILEREEEIADCKPIRKVSEQARTEKQLMSLPIRRLEDSLTLFGVNVTLGSLPSKSLFFVWSNAHSCR